MDNKINNSILQANIKLVDENKILEKDNKMLQKRIDRAIEYIENKNKFIKGCDVQLYTDWNFVIDILKGNVINE